MVAGQRLLLVTNYLDSSVTEITAATNRASAAIALPGTPSHVVFGPNPRFAYISNSYYETNAFQTGRLSILDTVTDSILSSILIPTTYVVGSEPGGIAITPDGRTAYVGNSFGGHVAEVDLQNGQILASIAVSNFSADDLVITADGRDVYLIGDGGTYVIATGSNSVTTLPGPPYGAPRDLALSPDGQQLYMAIPSGDETDSPTDYVQALDTASNIAEPQIPLSTEPSAVAITPDGRRAYVTNAVGNTVHIVDTSTLSLIDTVIVGYSPLAVAITPDGRAAYVTVSRSAPNGRGALAIIDTATDTVSTTFSIGDDPNNVLMSPDGSKAYVTVSGNGLVTMIDTALQKVTSSINIGNGPLDLALSPDGKTGYVTMQFQPLLSVLDMVQGRVSSTITLPEPGLGSGGRQLAMTPDGQFVYVAQLAGGVAVASTATGTAFTTIPVGSGPTGIAVTPDGKSVYVTNIGDGTVSVIDVATQTVSATITVGALPVGYGNFIAPGSPLASAVLPGSRSVELGTPATVFASLLNTSDRPLDGCGIALGTAPSALSMSYQGTDPATNQPIGQPGAAVDIAAGGSASFVLSFQSSAALTVQAQALASSCANATAAPLAPGVNSVDLAFSSTPVADIIALAASATPGVVVIPQSTGGAGAFAVATANVGAAGTLSVSVDTGGATLPISATICATDPVSGQCLAPAAANLSQDFAAGATPTYSVFLTATAPIAFSPATARIFVRFADAAGISHGSTSVAVMTN